MPPTHSIPSPYNFAPLPDSIFFPDNDPEAAMVSNDKPFEDGLSGFIDLSIAAKTPIFIGYGKEDPGRFFTLPDGTPAIPGTSIKGSLRDILSVASFSALECANQRYAVRDLNDAKHYTSWLTQRVENGFNEVDSIYPKTKAGWLIKRCGRYYIVPCENSRVEQQLVNGIFDMVHNPRVPQKPFDNNRHVKETKQKYAATGKEHPIQVLFHHEINHPHPKQNRDGRILFNLIYDKVIGLNGENCDKKGTLVMTGQTGDKHMEFIFHSPAAHDLQKRNESEVIPENAYPLSDEEFNEFVDLHSRERPGGDNASTGANKTGEPNKEWSFWRAYLEGSPSIPIPIFYLAFEESRSAPNAANRPKQTSQALALNEANSKLYSFGLAMMFRLSSRLDTHEARANSSQQDYLDFENGRCDLAQTIFGYVDDHGKSSGRMKRESSLRGRIQCEPLKLNDSENPRWLAERSIVLSTPKPPFAMGYIEQSSGNADGTLDPAKSKTVMDRDAKLRGWKRFPVRKQLQPSPQGTENMPTIRPLDAGSTFSGRLYFHNLRPFELGALQWALTFGVGTEQGSDKEYSHSLGMAKPLGYGAVQLNITDAYTIPNGSTLPDGLHPRESLKTLDQCMTVFKTRMESATEQSWLGSKTIKELLAIADWNRESDHESLVYPPLVDFRSFRGNRNDDARFLLPYSDLSGTRVDVDSIASNVNKLITERYPIGTKVTIVALKQSKKQKKDNRWAFSIKGEDGEDSRGRITPTESLPEDLRAGFETQAWVRVANRANFTFALTSPQED